MMSESISHVSAAYHSSDNLQKIETVESSRFVDPKYKKQNK